MSTEQMLTCLVCLVPWVVAGCLGGFAGWVLRGRAAVLGMPWALLPFGRWIKQQWESVK
jgi:hypothetical protein